MKFSTRLKEIRNSKNVLQKDIAALLKIDARNYRAYELGERPPSLEKLEIIADYFDVSTDYLLGRTDNPNSHKI